MKEVKRYQTENGKVWDTLKEVTRHEAWLDLQEAFEPIYGPVQGCRINFDDFAEWANENSRFLKTFVKFL